MDKWRTNQMIMDLLDITSVVAAHEMCKNAARYRPEMGRKGIVGLLSGAWDLFHYSHLRAIQQARRLCDFLLIGVGTDRLVGENKGLLRPIIVQEQRLAIVASLKEVDIAFLMDSEFDYGEVALSLVLPYNGVMFKSKEWLDQLEAIPGFDETAGYDPGYNKTVEVNRIGNVIILDRGPISTSSIISGICKRLEEYKCI